MKKKPAVCNLLFVTLFLGLYVTGLPAQTGGTFDLSHNVIATGGGASPGSVAGQTYLVEGTIGQGIAGSTSSSTLYSVRGGFWAFQALVPTAAFVSVSGRVLTASGIPIKTARVELVDSTGARRRAPSNPFGYYRIDAVEIGQTYLVEVISRQFQFIPLAIAVHDELTDLDLIALP